MEHNSFVGETARPARRGTVFARRASWREPFAVKLFSFLAVMVLIAAGLGCYWFWLIVTDNIGTFHNAATLADMDNDGDLDVVVHNLRKEAAFTAFGGATLWMNHGERGFAAVPNDSEGLGGWSSAPADVDGDGDADLVVFGGWVVRLVLNRGGAQEGEPGDFSRHVSVYAPKREGQFGSVVLGDLNNDGLVDGVIAGCCGRLFTVDADDNRPSFSWIWMNEGFPPRSSAASTSILSALDGLAIEEAALGDFDGDGDLDLFAAVVAPDHGRNPDRADRVLFNDGAGSFTDSGQRLGETDSPAVALGDLDGDGDLDALVGKGNGAEPWMNQGGIQGGEPGTFALALRRIPGGQIRAVLLSDLDGDRDLDALLAGRRRATVWWNDGEAGFTDSGPRFRYSRKHGLTVGDFDGDGWMDVFAASYARDYRIWHNQGDETFRAGPF